MTDNSAKNAGSQDFVFKYRGAIASRGGPPSPMTRLVLHTLTVFMDKTGGNCFPSTVTIAEAAGISERSVCTHLMVAVESGWLMKTVAGKNGQGWKRHRYHPAIPKALNEGTHFEAEGTERGSAPNLEGTERVSAPFSEGTELGAEGTESGDIKALKEVQSTKSVTKSNISENGHSFLLKNGDAYHVSDDAIQEIRSAYPGLNIESELKKLRVWCFSNPDKRKTARGALRFVNGWMARAAKTQPAVSSSAPRGFEL